MSGTAGGAYSARTDFSSWIWGRGWGRGRKERRKDMFEV